MAEIGISIAAKAAEYSVQPVIHLGEYLFCINKFLRNLEDKKKKLMSTRDTVLTRIEEAKRKTERIEDVVEKWLTEVQSLVHEVEKLEQEVKANNTNCFQAWCPTWRRYHLCKQMVDKTKEIIELDNKSNFKTFARLATLPGIDYSSTEGFAFFESTKLAYAQLWEALNDDGIYRIGLYGMGGSGKTTLVTEVGKKAKESNLFDQVVLITVSQTPNIRNLQGQMADLLNFELKEETEVGRAQRLHMRLKEEKKILIIVDDVWEKFDLKDIGIALDICHNASYKVMLTTRRQQVCTHMDCQRKVLLGLLNEDEVWALFQTHAHIDDQSSLCLLNGVAQNVARECKGLPIAIQAVGRSLKGQSIHEWKIALENLRSSKPVDVEEGQRDAFSCLKLSYDFLKDENKLLLLMCCIFPEDHKIIIEDLIRCGVGLGVYGGYQSFDSARNQITAGINKLVDSCLLMLSETRWGKGALRMHDLVRDLGLWIAFNEGRNIMVNLSDNLNSLIRDGVIKDHFAISSWYSRTNQISTPLAVAKLEILWIETDCSLDLSSARFESLQGLKVLVLRCSRFHEYLSLSPSIESLSNLRTLCLRRWRLRDISFVVRLIKLEVLELTYCHFHAIPDEFGNLNKLKLLDLSECRISKNYVAIGKLSEIEELYVTGADKFRRASFLDNVTATNLQRYVLRIGAGLLHHGFTKGLIMREIYLQSMNISSLSASLKNLLQRAEYVHFYNLHGNCQTLIPNIVGTVGGMNDLAMLDLVDCFETECVLDTTSDHVDVQLPALVKLCIMDMRNLKEVCHGPLPLGFFEKLQEILITDCPQLHSIFPMECKLSNLKSLRISHCRAVAVLFSMSVACSLSQLEELHIRNCEELKHIITEEDRDGMNTGEEIVPASHSSRLIFPYLKRLSVIKCDKLEYILPVSCIEGLEQLQEIEIKQAFRLKYVFGQDQRDNSFHEKDIQITFPILKVLNLKLLMNLCSICPKKYHITFPSLTYLYVADCQKLGQLLTLVDTAMRQLHQDKGVSLEESQQKQLISKIGNLNLENLPELESIWTVHAIRQCLSLQYLQELGIQKCSKLKYLFSMVVSRNLPELRSLTVEKCKELEVIMEENEELDNQSNAQVSFSKLKIIRVSFCRKLKSLFPVASARMLSQLSILDISCTDQLEVIFRKNSEEGTSNGQEIVVLNFEELRLVKLPSFVGIFPQFNLQAVNLAKKMVIDECPKFASFIEATQAIPHHGITEGSQASTTNNSQVTSVVKEKNGIWNVKGMYLKNLKCVKCIGEGSTLVSFRYLVCLRVSGCRRLEFIFCAGVNRSLCLPQLRYLYIENCEELKEIISEYPDQAQECGSKDTSKAQSHPVCFPNLIYFLIKRCSKLKSVFLISMVKHLPQLRHMEIRKCSQVEQVFCCPNDANDGAVKELEVVLPKLEVLILIGLPNLNGIFGGSNQLQLPALQDFTAMDCPSFSSTTYATSESIEFLLKDHLELRFCIHEEEGDVVYTELLSQSYNSENEKEDEKNIRNIVGNYEFSFKFKGEPWILNFETFSPTPILKYGFGHNLDADLFIKGKEIWDEEMVRRLYTKKAAEVILRNQVPKSEKHTYLTYCNSGFFEDEYLFRIHEELKNATVLHRHKFLWSGVLLGVLPVKCQLKKIFKSEKYSTCFLCSQAPETVDHLFLHCSFIRSLWFISPWGFRADNWSCLTMLEWFGFLTNHSLIADSIGISSEELLLFASVMMDKVWEERNRLAHASDSNPPDNLKVANSILAAYFEMKNKSLTGGKKKRVLGKYGFSFKAMDDIICRDGWFKAYFDTARTKEEGWAAVLLLNHEGKLIGARTRKLSTKFLLEQEALALELAVELSCDVVPKSNICLEGDCERVISILNDYLNDEVDYEARYLEPILMDIREKLGSMGDWEGKRICRNFNRVAYNAAKWAAFCNSEGDVLNSVPTIEVLSRKDFVSSFFTNDEDEYDHDNLLNNSDNEDDDGLLRLKPASENFNKDEMKMFSILNAFSEGCSAPRGSHSAYKQDQSRGTA